MNLKLVGVYVASKDYYNAINVLSKLRQNYLCSKKIKGSLLDVLFLNGKKLEKEGKLNSGLDYYEFSVHANQLDNSAVLILNNFIKK